MELLGIIFVISFLATFATANLMKGENHKCKKDSEAISKVRDLLHYDPCVVCSCQNQTVTCDKRRCPSLEGCYRIPTTSKDKCCPQCSDCRMDNRTLEHGWHSQEECQNQECQAGVVTKSEIVCKVPCSNAIQPKKGECCGRCPGCWVDGKVLREGEEMTLKTDPCVRCRCQEGHVTCEKRACPVLSCPPSRTYMDKDGCCPICKGKRVLFTLPGGRCFLGTHVYNHNDSLSIEVDRCTTCICAYGSLVCQRTTCMPLHCPRQYQVHDPSKCCTECRRPERHEQVCMTEGVIRNHGETWHRNKCTPCKCENGQVTCTALECPSGNDPCPLGHKRIQDPSECCSQCQAEPGVCIVFGDPHYRTYDGYHFTYQGDCKYELTKDAEGGMFAVRVNNDPRLSKQFTWTRSISVRIQIEDTLYKISLGQKFKVKVNGKRERLPFIVKDNALHIARKNYSLIMNTSIGLNVLWDGISYVELEVDSSWFNKTKGLCGNFNGDASDDLLKKNGKMALKDIEMAESWRIHLRKCIRKTKHVMNSLMKDRRRALQPRLPCKNSRDEALRRCEAFKHPKISVCHGRVSFEKFYESCLLDMCECPSEQKCECDSLTAYIRLCIRSGVSLEDWRHITECGGLACPKGAQYRSCVPACQPTCRKQLSASCLTSRCREGCFCPFHQVLHRGACIPTDECPAQTKRRRKRFHKNSRKGIRMS